jgi:acetoacetyl-CoA reductase
MTRVAVATGGTRGIGAEISKALAGAGYSVVANYGGNDAVAQAFHEATGIAVQKWDVSDLEACKAGLAKVEADYGPVDILINNAGITRDTMFHRMTPDQWHEVINTNFNALYNMCRPVIEKMRERGFGRIISLSSINAQRGQLGQSNYAATKAGMIGFSKCLALENAAKGITVNVVAPGYTDTEMMQAVPENVMAKILSTIPAGRVARAEEIARAVLFLASDDAAYITGSTISINGGQYLA